MLVSSRIIGWSWRRSRSNDPGLQSSPVSHATSRESTARILIVRLRTFLGTQQTILDDFSEQLASVVTTGIGRGCAFKNTPSQETEAHYQMAVTWGHPSETHPAPEWTSLAGQSKRRGPCSLSEVMPHCQPNHKQFQERIHETTVGWLWKSVWSFEDSQGTLTP